MGLNNICLEGDAKLVVDGINSGGPRWTRIGFENVIMLVHTLGGSPCRM
jgi:hypothetical protein